MTAFRRALEGLADDAGPGDADRAAAIRGRAQRIAGRRRTLLAGTAAVTVAAVAGAAAGTLPGDDRDRLAVAPATEVPVVPTTEPPTPSPTPFVTPQSRPTPSARGSASPATVHPPVRPSSTVVAAEPAVTIRVVRGGATGEETELEVHVADPRGSVAALLFSFGLDDPGAAPDTTNREFPGAGVSNRGGDVDHVENVCVATPRPDLRAPADTTFRYRHAFRFPGTYTAWARVKTGTCDGVARGWNGTVVTGANVTEGRLAYAVTGRAWVNGPATPTVRVAFRRDHWQAPDTVDDGPGLQVTEFDDGRLARVRVDWGDGTVEDVAFGKDESRDGGRWHDCAHPFEFGDPTQDNVAKPDHTYAQPGRYTVTVTVTTTSCDGGEEQTATASGTWDWPPPTATPSAPGAPAG